jgi:glutathione S-transferase
MITISAFSQVPDFAKGLVRDVRVRWALEEAGLPYDVRHSNREIRINLTTLLHAFGQVPIFEEDGLVPFESAIVLHIGERSGGAAAEKPGGARPRCPVAVRSAQFRRAVRRESIPH